MACHIALLLLICVPGRLAIHCYYLPVMSWRVSFLISFFSSIFRYFVLFLGLAMTKNQITNAKCQLQFFLTFQLKKQRQGCLLFLNWNDGKNIWFLAFDFYSLNPMKRTFLQIKTYHSQDLHYICNRVPLCPELLLPCTTYQSVPSAINLRHAFDISKRMSCLLHCSLHDAAAFSKVRLPKVWL